MLQRALIGTRDLIKLRCMRRTLHTVPVEVAPIVHSATLRQRIAEPLRMLQDLCGGSEQVLRRALAEVIDEANFDSLTWVELGDYLIKHRRKLGLVNCTEIRPEIGRQLAKLTWELGYVGYENIAEHWRKEKRRFRRTRGWVDSLRSDTLDATSASRGLIERYVKAFGPVSIGDAIWWSGLGRRQVIDALNEIRRNIIAVKVSELSSSLWMTEEDYSIAIQRRNGERWVQFLAHEDPSLKGYYETRSRYVRPEFSSRLFNAIGEARSSIIVDGEVVGIWSWNERRQRIDTTMFECLDPTTRGLIEKQRTALEQFYLSSWATEER